jgi:hypothetical protein
MKDWLDEELSRTFKRIEESPEPQEFIEGVEYTRGGNDKPVISKWLSSEQIKLLEALQPESTIVEPLAVPRGPGYFIIKEYKTEFNKHFEIWELVGVNKKLVLHLVGELK